jgi:hypothetical protein
VAWWALVFHVWIQRNSRIDGEKSKQKSKLLKAFEKMSKPKWKLEAN